jgi:ribosomal protein L17
LLLESISDHDLKAIVDKLVTEAKSGDLAAIKILLDRLIPPPRCRAVALDLPPLNAGTARSKASALGAVLEAMAAGQIDPAEAEAIARLVEATAEAAQNCGGF